MINKRELVLFLSLSFCMGVIVSDLTKPKEIKADVTNIVAETLDAKISVVAGDVSSLRARVAALESTTTSHDAKIAALSDSVRSLGDIQKSAFQGFVDLKRFNILSDKVTLLETIVKSLSAEG